MKHQSKSYINYLNVLDGKSIHSASLRELLTEMDKRIETVTNQYPTRIPDLLMDQPIPEIKYDDINDCIIITSKTGKKSCSKLSATDIITIKYTAYDLIQRAYFLTKNPTMPNKKFWLKNAHYRLVSYELRQAGIIPTKQPNSHNSKEY